MASSRQEQEQREFALEQQFDMLIRDPDPAGMLIAEDLVLANKDVMSLADYGEHDNNNGASGQFTLSPFHPADAPLVASGWELEPARDNYGVVSGLRVTYEIYWQSERFLHFAEHGKYYRTKIHARHAAAADAWAIAKYLKAQPSDTPLKTIEDGSYAALTNTKGDTTPRDLYERAPTKQKKRTYVEAQDAAIDALGRVGWSLSPRGLKTPWAQSPNGRMRLWFKPQAVWMSHVEPGTGEDQRHNLKSARSVGFGFGGALADMREMSGSEFVQAIYGRWPKVLGPRPNPPELEDDDIPITDYVEPPMTHWNQLHVNPSLLNNPAWITKTLAKTFEQLEAKVPSKWLPRLEDVTSSRTTLKAQAHELGCGSYGCVLPTLDPKVVLKVTTDQTEAEFAAKLSKKLVVPVVVTYELAMSVPGAKHDGRDIYLLWREEASDVGGLTGKPDTLVEAQHAAAQLCYELIYNGETGPELRDALDQWEITLEAMAKDRELNYLATGMLRNFRELGIGLFDVHAGNVGRCMRDGTMRWIVIDPGHVAVIKQAN